MAGWRWGGCSVGMVQVMKEWTMWWRTGYCWNPAGSALVDGPSGTRRKVLDVLLRI